MADIAVAASILLGVVFLMAGAAKLALGAAWPPQARALGAPNWAVPVVPYLEIVLGAGMVTGVLWPAPPVIAAIMLVLFSGLIGWRLRQGKRPVCACFGAWSSAPVGPWSLVRNAALLVVAVLSLGR